VITYYRDETVAVTSTYVQIEDRRFRLSELRYVWHRRDRPDWRVRRRTAGRGLLNTLMVLAAVAGLVALVGLIASAYGESKLAAAVGRLPVPRDTLLLFAVLLLVAGLAPLMWEWALNRVDDSYVRGNAVYEIWAETNGAQVLLLRIDDAARFGKIYRALERALGQ
jgi:hypothetical protein